MFDATQTNTALLQGLHNAGDTAAWRVFDARYRPIIIGFARRVGLSDADAADVAQETILQFITEYRQGRYDRSRARLRAWLIGIARARVAGAFRKAAVRREKAGVTAVVDLEDDGALSSLWDQERRAAILQLAMEELRSSTRTSDKTIQAFDMLTVRQLPPAAVAEALGMTVHDVYLAKSRVAQRLREIIERVEVAFDGEE